MKKADLYSSRALIRRLVQDYTKPHLVKLSVAVICMIMVALATAAMAKVIEPMINEIFTEKNPDAMIPVAATVMVIFAVKGFAGFAQSVLMNDIGRKITKEIQIQLFGRIVRHDLERYHQVGTGSLVARFTSDAAQMYRTASTALIAFCRDAVSLVALVGVMFSLDFVLSLIVFVLFPTAVLPAFILGRRMRVLAREQHQLIGQITSLLTQAFQGIRHVKAYNAEDRETNRVSRTINHIAKLSHKAAVASSLSRPILEILTGISVVLIVFYGGYQVIEGAKTPGAFFAFITAMLLAYEPMKRLVGLNLIVQRGLAAAERVFSAMDVVPSIRDKPGASELRLTDGRVELDDVHFSYGKDAPALTSLSLVVPAGKTVALVGPSGAGKSTILNLLPRFYDVDSGKVTIDGVDVRDITLHSLRGAIALVSQDITLFDDTVHANIAYGRPTASDSEIEAAARYAFAHEFVKDLPKGYDTVIGEQGVRLSGGQRQRLSIARAVLKDAPILLLDEATSSLDTQSEQLIQQALQRLKAGRTTLVIAHRLSTVRDADLIYVIERGRVIESGTHSALVRQNGLFAHLWALQTAAESEDAPDFQPLGIASHGS